MNLIDNFEKLLASGTDNAMLRFSLGNAYYQTGEFEAAMVHLRQADSPQIRAGKHLRPRLSSSGASGSRPATARGYPSGHLRIAGDGFSLFLGSIPDRLAGLERARATSRLLD